MLNKSIKLNYLYNLIYQILLIITPLITAPYISRVLGPSNIGLYSFHESIVSCFVVLANLGMAMYAQREISYYQEDKTKKSIIFWNMKVLAMITCTISSTIYLCLGIRHSQNPIYFIFSLNIISVFFDISWFFQGIEEFGKIILRNVILKIINIIFIFVFIKDQGDFKLYTFGMCIFVLLGHFSLWLYLPKFINKPDFKRINPFNDVNKIIMLFLPTIAIQIYTVIDKTMIGILTTDTLQNGYYEQALKITRIILTIVTSLGIVMIPRIGHFFSKGQFDNVKKYMGKSYRFVWFLGVPLCLGLIGVSPNFVPWFFGEDFIGAIPLLTILSFLILAVGVNNITGAQYLIPTGREKIYTFSVTLGAIINFTLNLILIPLLLAKGAAIASVIAETSIAIIQLLFIRKEIHISVVVNGIHKYLISGLIMYLVLFLENQFLNPSMLNTLILLFTGTSCYFLILFVLKDDFFITYVKSFLNMIKNKLIRY